MNTYIWKITDMKANSEGGVTNVSWECIATTPEGESYTATGSKDYEPDPTDSSYTPIAELTEEAVLEWVWRFFHKDGIENHCDAQITYQENLKSVNQSITLPWGTPE